MDKHKDMREVRPKSRKRRPKKKRLTAQQRLCAAYASFIISTVRGSIVLMERMARMNTALAKAAVGSFEDDLSAARWLIQFDHRLNGSPLGLCSTGAGLKAVLQCLGKIRKGVFS
jgi:hypothetical protein